MRTGLIWGSFFAVFFGELFSILVELFSVLGVFFALRLENKSDVIILFLDTRNPNSSDHWTKWIPVQWGSEILIFQSPNPSKTRPFKSPDVLVRISNGFWQNGCYFSGFQMIGLPDFRSHSKTRPFTTQPLLDHSKFRLGRMSDPYCIQKLCVFWMPSWHVKKTGQNYPVFNWCVTWQEQPFKNCLHHLNTWLVRYLDHCYMGIWFKK